MIDETAIKSLENSILEIQKLDKEYPHSENHIKWISDTLFTLEDIFGQDSRIYVTFASLTWQPTDSFYVPMRNADIELTRRRLIAYVQQLEISKGILRSGIEQIKKKGVKNVYKGKDTPPESSEIIKIISLIENKLRKIIRVRPNQETEIQNALDNLFIGSNLDGHYTRDKEDFSYSSKSYKPDFIFSKIDTVVEVKLCKTDDKEKAIIAEINDDILAYKSKFSNLIFVVYDLGIIRDQDHFRTDLESSGNVVVKIIKH